MNCHIGWDNLPQDVIILLIERLIGITNFIRASAVCTYWHSIFMANNNCYKQVPWLMLPEFPGIYIARRDFYDIATNEQYRLCLPQAHKRKAAGSAHGWLVTAGMDSKFHLFNPLKGVQITLPPGLGKDYLEKNAYTPEKIRKQFMVKATLSPMLENEYTVLAVHQGEGTDCLSYCRSNDGAWNKIKTDHYLREVAYIKGKFYSINTKGTVFACEINTPTPKVEEILSVPPDKGYYERLYYLVECGGELLVVMKRLFLYMREDDDPGYCTESFKIFKLDLTAKTAIQIESIGDYALFLGLNNSVCLPTTADCKRCKRNCIYYTDDYHDGLQSYWVGDEMGVFKLDDGKKEAHYAGRYSMALFSTAIWITPNPW